MELNLPLNRASKTSFYLTPEQGNKIRELIVLQIDTSFRYYINNKVGLADSNVSAILNGKRPLSISMLEKILSGTRITLAQCTLNFTLENVSGGIVPYVPSPTIEEMLYSQEIGQLDEENNVSDQSSQSGKGQGKLKTLLGSRSWENPEESSD